MVLFLDDLLACVHLVTLKISTSLKKLSLYCTSVLYLNFKFSFQV